MKKSPSRCLSVDLFLLMGANLALAFIQNKKGRLAVVQACQQINLKSGRNQVCCISHLES